MAIKKAGSPTVPTSSWMQVVRSIRFIVFPHIYAGPHLRYYPCCGLTVFFYSFSWQDLKTPSLELMMRIVQVISFTVNTKRRKVSVHCHAGLGRTGLAIACWFIFEHRYSAMQAVTLVRTRRPGSIQTSAQLSFCQEFESWLWQLRR